MSLNPRIADWAGRRVWVIGASSGIGRATAALLHTRGAQVVVSARGTAALEAFTQAHPGSIAVPLDSTDAQAVQAAAEALLANGPLDLVCYCAGHYESQRATDFDLAAMLRHDDTNYRGALHVLAAVLPAMLGATASGAPAHLCLVSSVAGFCGLPRGLAYGPTKAALTNLAEALYLDLHVKGIGVSVVHPGFVATPLTAGNPFPMPALTTPEAAAEAIVHGWERGRFEIHFPPPLHAGDEALAPAALRGVFPGRAPADGAGMKPGPLTPPDAMARAVAFFEHLQAAHLAALEVIYAPDARFKDPFNEVQGLRAIGGVFEHMFATLDAPRFVVTGRVLQGTTCFLTWDFCFGMRSWRRGQEQVIRGASQLVFDEAGRITLHRDYWDAAEELYEKLPLLGALMRWLKRRARSA